MTRIAFLALFVAAVVSLVGGPARAELPVAPPPREVRPDGTRDPAPKPEPPKDENPAVTVERIIKNSKQVGDKLAMTDTSTETRKKQDKILSDIDSLINRQENPPPKPDDKNQDKEKEKEKNPDQPQDKDKEKEKNPDKGMDMKSDPKMNEDMHPKMGDPMNKGGMGMQDDMPMPGGMDDPAPMGRRPRMGEQKGEEKNQGEAKKNQQKQPVGGEPKDSKNTAGMAAGNPGGKVPVRPALPFNEDVARDVWGHLPDKLRMQMTQYYKEDFMPRYSELLRLYYHSLSEKSANPGMPKR
jgi:hypothetical protein